VFDQDETADRRFSLVRERVADAEIAATLARETRFDPDLWVVAVEDRQAGRSSRLPPAEGRPGHLRETLFPIRTCGFAGYRVYAPCNSVRIAGVRRQVLSPRRGWSPGTAASPVTDVPSEPPAASQIH